MCFAQDTIRVNSNELPCGRRRRGGSRFFLLVRGSGRQHVPPANIAVKGSRCSTESGCALRRLEGYAGFFTENLVNIVEIGLASLHDQDDVARDKN